jgi:NAD(P)-dependent dehydrogenase (short-subunit alcohol dehydrogenase family)
MTAEDRFGLQGRTAVVTGGTRGIGRSIAHGFGAAGASVVVASRKPEACSATEAALAEQGIDALAVPTHMGSLDDVERLVRAAVDRFGGIDIVVNNAATSLDQPIGSLTPAAWGKAFDVNLRGPVFLVQAALPHLRRSRAASVVNVVSTAAFVFAPGAAMYGAAKAALVSFTRSMAAELAPDHVRVNALCPGGVDTDMVRAHPPAAREGLRTSCLMQRIADPDEMAGPAIFLASDAASFMTGQTLFVDGGTVSR